MGIIKQRLEKMGISAEALEEALEIIQERGALERNGTTLNRLQFDVIRDYFFEKMIIYPSRLNEGVDHGVNWGSYKSFRKEYEEEVLKDLKQRRSERG